MNVLLRKRIVAGWGINAAEDVLLQRRTELPYPPIPALLVAGVDWQETIVAVTYSIVGGVYIASVIDDRQLVAPDAERLGEIVKGYIALGWEVRSIPSSKSD